MMWDLSLGYIQETNLFTIKKEKITVAIKEKKLSIWYLRDLEGAGKMGKERGNWYNYILTTNVYKFKNLKERKILKQFKRKNVAKTMF